MTASSCARAFRSAACGLAVLSAAEAATLGSAAALLAAELSVMSAGAMEPAVVPLAIQFQHASGHTIAVEYGTAPQLAARLAQEQTADVIIAPAAVIDQVVAEGRAAPHSRVAIGRIGVGVFVRAGAPRPDVASAAALRTAVLAAEHIVYTQGSSGQYIDTMLETLGVAVQLGSRLVRVADAETALARVAAGTSGDLGFGAITAIKAFEGKGTTYIAPLPDSLQNFTGYDGAIMKGARSPQAAADFLKFLITPAARRTLERAGIQ